MNIKTQVIAKMTSRVLAFSPLIITVQRMILGNVNSQINTSPQAFHCMKGLKCIEEMCCACISVW